MPDPGAKYVMYVKPVCPYCDQAREGLRADGIEWEERDATRRPDWRAELMGYSKRTGRVPTLVQDDRVISVGWNGHG